MSMASWIASIEVYIRVALAACTPGDDEADAVAYLPGKIGRVFVAQTLGLPDKRSVQIANFLGDALDFTQQALSEEGRTLPLLWLAGHPGKLAKVLDGVWDTHSSKSNMAMQGVARVAQDMNAAGEGELFPRAVAADEGSQYGGSNHRAGPPAGCRSRAASGAGSNRIAALAQARVPAVAHRSASVRSRRPSPGSTGMTDPRPAA
jgi:cobalt-precorrin-5B (C1)-methyltransferase